MPISLDNKQHNPAAGEKGAALITVTVILILVSVMIVFGLKMFKTDEPVDRRRATQQQLAFLTDQIASYVHREQRLPCPADPALPLAGTPPATFGLESRADNDADPFTPSNLSCNRVTGILPFRTLNLDEHHARDEWGRYITYAISPVFADTQNTAYDSQIYYMCRKSAHWTNSSQVSPAPTPPVDATNMNIRKARFCCPGINIHAPATDLEIRNETGNQINLRPDQGPAPAAGNPQRTGAVHPLVFGSMALPATDTGTGAVPPV